MVDGTTLLLDTTGEKSNIEKPEPRAYYNSKVALHFNITRLGEAYLNLAEAQLLKKNIPAAVAALNETRTKHGGLAPSTASTEEQAWADYIRERNCEWLMRQEIFTTAIYAGVNTVATLITDELLVNKKNLLQTSIALHTR